MRRVAIGLILGCAAMFGLFLGIQYMAQRDPRRAHSSSLARIAKAHLSHAYAFIKGADPGTGKQANTPGTPTAFTLTVHVLPTSDGLHGKGMYANRYPKNVRVRNVGAFAHQIAAFGAAYHVWIGPRGWTGSAGYGEYATRLVDLYPVGGSPLSGPHIEFLEIPFGLGSMLYRAAPYFPKARLEYNKTYHTPLLPAPPGLRIFPLSPTLERYSLPSVGSLLVRGIVYFGYRPNPFFAEAEFVLPHADEKLLHFLMHTFIRREKLK
jgi:hypothetical protein